MKPEVMLVVDLVRTGGLYPRIVLSAIVGLFGFAIPRLSVKLSESIPIFVVLKCKGVSLKFEARETGLRCRPSIRSLACCAILICTFPM
jgi:hypothetical protein